MRSISIKQAHKRSGLNGRDVARSVIGVLCFAAAMMFAYPCFGYPRMGPAMNRDIRKFIHSNSAIYPLPPGWKIDNFSFTDLDITVALKSIAGEADVRLSYPWVPVIGKVAGETLSFRLEILSAKGAGAEKAAMDFCKRIKGNDRIYFFSSKNMARRESWLEYMIRRHVFAHIVEHKVFFTIALALALLALLRPGLILDHLMPGGACARIALLAVFVLGLTLRLCVSPSTPIHCNTHGIREVKMYLSLQGSDVTETAYGSVFPSAMRWILGFIGPNEKNVFMINEIFGTLAILGIFLFAKGLTGCDATGIFSALFFSVAPSQVWMAGTESQIPMFQFIGLSGLGILCLSVRSRNISLLWLATILISFASSLRILTVLIVPVAAVTAVYLGVLDRKDCKSAYMKHVIACLSAGVACALFHYVSIPMMTGKGWSESNPVTVYFAFFFRYGLSFRNTILDPTLTPFIVPAAAAAAFILSLKKDRRFALFAAVLFLTAVPMTFSVLDCRTSAVRYQTQAHWIYYILAASVFTAISRDCLRVKRTVIAAALAILAVAGSVPGLILLHKGDVEMNEYWFIRKTAMKIPPASVIRLPVDYAVSGKLITDYPGYINGHIVVKGRGAAKAGKRELIYIGLDCYKYGSDKEKEQDLLPNGKRKQCVDICNGRLAPLYETKLDARHPLLGYHDLFHSLGSLTPAVGFYECIPYEK